MTFNATQRIVVTVKNNNGQLSNISPISLKNQIQDQVFNSIEDLPDVAEVSVTDGATLVYNANNDLYEVKQINLDGGEF